MRLINLHVTKNKLYICTLNVRLLVMHLVEIILFMLNVLIVVFNNNNLAIWIL